MFSIVERIPASFARAPYDTVSASSTLATAVVRAGSAPISPVYQVTVLDAVPAVIAVAVNGEPETRIGGWPASTSKNMCAAAIVDAVVSEVAPSLPTAAESAACRLAAVCVGVAPMANVPADGEFAVA